MEYGISEPIKTTERTIRQVKVANENYQDISFSLQLLLICLIIHNWYCIFYQLNQLYPIALGIISNSGVSFSE